MKLLLRLVVLVGALLSAEAVLAQHVPSWQGSALLSIARIESQRCPGVCPVGKLSPTARHGTGFVVKVEQFDEPVLLTALHVIAGANDTTYQFTEAGAEKVATEVLAADKDADIALLRLSDADRYSVSPLSLTTQLPADNNVIVYGFKAGALSVISDNGLVKLKGPSLLSKAPLGSEVFEKIKRLGYPNVDLPIIALEEALNSGDSGGPVFNGDGQVLGMAHGGLPSSDAQLTWMVGAERIQALNLKQLDARKLMAYGFKELFAAREAFYEPFPATKIGSEPGLYVALEWSASFSPMREFAERANEAWLGNSLNERGRYGGVIVPPNSDAFFKDDAWRQALSSLKLNVICYRAEVFDQMISSSDPIHPQGDLELTVPAGSFAQTATDPGMVVEFQSQSPHSRVRLYSSSFIKYRPMMDAFSLHPDIHTIEQLYGGGCRLRLGAADDKFRLQVDELNAQMQFGGSCLHLFLGQDTHTPISFTSMLSLDGNGPGELWGILPADDPGGTVDDLSCQ